MDKQQFSKFIGQLSVEELRTYISVFLKENPEIQDLFIKFINSQIKKVGISNVEKDVKETFKATKNNGSRWQSNWITDWESISKNSNELFARAHDAIEAGNPDIALTIGVSWLENFVEEYDDYEAYCYDDEDAYLSYDCEAAEKVIDKAISHPKASDEIKKEAARRLEKLAESKNSPFSEYDYLDIYALSARVKAMSLGDQDALEYLNELLENDFDNTTLIIQKYNLLKKMGRSSEAVAFIEENIDNQGAANFYVTELVEAKNNEKLIDILKNITDPEYSQYNMCMYNWLETLASAQDEIGQSNDATETFQRLFKESHGEMKYYLTLKKRIAQSKWTEYLDELMLQTSFYESSFDGKCNYGDILIEEKRFQQLHDWLMKQSKYAFSYYLSKLPQALRADLIPIYSKLILEAASMADKRDSYARVCGHLSKIKELPEGITAAQEIASEIRNKYSRRPAFMEELRRVMGR